jgi:S1-C subfamily serine protease
MRWQPVLVSLALLAATRVANAQSAVNGCASVGSLRSIDGVRPLSVTFANESPEDIRIYWIDYTGQRKLYGDLRPKESLDENTYGTHPWLITDERDNCLYAFVAQSSGTIPIRLAEQLPNAQVTVPLVTQQIVNSLSSETRQAINVKLEQEISATASALDKETASRGSQIAKLEDSAQTLEEAKGVVNGQATASVSRERRVEELIMSLTRPVWLLCNAQPWPRADLEHWLPYVQGFTQKSPTEVDSVGILRAYKIENGRQVLVGAGALGSAFAISDRLILTNRHVLEEIVQSPFPKPPWRLPVGYRVTFDPGNEFEGCASRLADVEVPVELVLSTGKDDDDYDYAVMLLEKNKAVTGTPVADTPVINGDRVAVIGYPAEPAFSDNHMTQDQIDQMFSPPGSFSPPFLVKRISPGRVMNISGLVTEFAYDANTFGGNSGSAVFRLSDGALVGLHIGGMKNDEGSQDYNLAIRSHDLARSIRDGARVGDVESVCGC